MPLKVSCAMSAKVAIQVGAPFGGHSGHFSSSSSSDDFLDFLFLFSHSNSYAVDSISFAFLLEVS